MQSANRLALFVDGEFVARPPPFDTTTCPVDANQPFRLGTGSNGPLNGTPTDVRLYRRAISVGEIAALAKRNPKE